MIWNYIKIALRVLRRNRLYAAINIVCLSIGLAVFLFSQVLGDYERSYDLFFEDAENICVPFVLISPTAPIGIRVAPVPSPAKQLLEAVEGIEQISFAITDQVVVKIDDDKFYQRVRFLNPQFFDIFNFDFIYGSAASSLATPNSVALNEPLAKRYFGDENPLGKVITVNGDHLYTVSAVFRELPKNSHFESTITGFNGFEMAINMDGYRNLTDFDGIGQWGNISTNQSIYLKLAPGETLEQIYERVDARFVEQTPPELREFLEAIRFRQVAEMNLYPWEASGIPGVLVLEILGFVVLVVVVLNYSNLAYAQALGRAREVGVRKALGASRKNIFYQFIIEGIVLSSIAGLGALAIINTVLPFLNEAVDRNITFNLISQPGILALFMGTVLFTGIVTGIYPAMILTRLSVVKIISGGGLFGGKKNWSKNILLVCQFTASVILVTMAAVITYQNSLLDNTSKQYELENIANITSVREELFGQYDSLRQELLNIPGVNMVSATSQIPFEQNQSMFSVGRTRMDDDEVIVQSFSVDEDYFDIFDVRMVAGRSLFTARDLIAEQDMEQGGTVPIVINQTAVADLGWQSAEQAVGDFILPISDEDEFQYQVVGVMEDRNYSGMFGSLKPLIFYINSEEYDTISLHVDENNYGTIMSAVERIWDAREPEYPITIRSLVDEFEENYQILRGVNLAVGLLAVLAVLFTMAGLFGLAAYIAGQRTREFAIRKVMGAPVLSLVRLILWQFSIPLLIALAIGMPVAVIATDTYLELFVERVSLGVLFFSVPAVTMLLITWAIISIHALRVAHISPAMALRNE